MNEERRVQLLESFGRSKMMELFGAKVGSIDQGYIEISVDKQEFMARPAGMFNGSTIAALVDVASGYAAASAKPVDSYFTTVELKVNYLNPAMGEQLLAKGQVIKNGKVITVVRVDVYSIKDNKESLAATSLVTMMMLSTKHSRKK
ncbi:thioesterase [Chitinophaga caeni]|uniref:Thioesterase n=1 Tax=Chitinophaga caeni TaxID=2029983 RepID=A0A291QZP5_9BACT|nr:PaaI family thioesterase [Chitinophaga caeni]ATL49362.1 thioesterase [Chitinophaga caeni]